MHADEALHTSLCRRMPREPKVVDAATRVTQGERQRNTMNLVAFFEGLGSSQRPGVDDEHPVSDDQQTHDLPPLAFPAKAKRVISESSEESGGELEPAVPKGAGRRRSWGAGSGSRKRQAVTATPAAHESGLLDKLLQAKPQEEHARCAMNEAVEEEVGSAAAYRVPWPRASGFLGSACRRSS